MVRPARFIHAQNSASYSNELEDRFEEIEKKKNEEISTELSSLAAKLDSMFAPVAAMQQRFRELQLIFLIDICK